VLALLSAGAADAETLAYPDLVRRLWDMERLAVLPTPGERAGQWSSTDRRSRFDAATNTYVAWDADDDAAGYIREEPNGDRVLAEMNGPGCIWRIWSEEPGPGRIRIFIDGSEEPAVDAPFRALFDGSTAPFTRSALVYESAGGFHSYVPIPYQRSCRIVAEPEWGGSYAIGFGSFPDGTMVPSFTGALDAEAAAALDDADARLSKPGSLAGSYPDAQTLQRSLIVMSGSRSRIRDVDGPAAITGIRMILQADSSERAKEIMRSMVLQIEWDNEFEPSVWCPVGDFFGAAPGVNSYYTWSAGTNEGRWYANWYMPFARDADIRIINEGPFMQRVRLAITHAPLTRPIEAYGRFHAKWHRDAYLPAQPARAMDWPVIKTLGRGRFVGVAMHVWNPSGVVWGTGDQKFFVDHERYPSLFGTATDHYFGFGSGRTDRFSRPYHAQTLAEENGGHVSLNRWHISDDVPFQSGLEASLGKKVRNAHPVLYDAVAYWYLDPEGVDPYRPIEAPHRLYWPAGPPRSSATQ
jgi:hypothetical protein